MDSDLQFEPLSQVSSVSFLTGSEMIKISNIFFNNNSKCKLNFRYLKRMFNLFVFKYIIVLINILCNLFLKCSYFYITKNMLKVIAPW